MNDSSPDRTLLTPAGRHYLDVLADMHREIRPEWYLEIGTQTGRSLALSKARTVSVDPEYQLRIDAAGQRPETHLFQQTSDAFFASGALDRLGVRFDLAFLDGMHLYEYLLRDVANTERWMAPGGRIVLHDCLPSDPSMAVRNRRKSREKAWTGDVWKLVPILARWRPDLDVTLYDAAPTGLVVIGNLDPDSRVLEEAHDQIRAEWDRADDRLTRIVGGFRPRPADATPWTIRTPARAKAPLSFAIQTPVPRARVADAWGDHHFATGLAAALTRLGHAARVQPKKTWAHAESGDEIDLVLRGRETYQKRRGHPLLYWIISNDGAALDRELAEADHVFAAGAPLADRLAGTMGADRVSVLPQAFDRDRMFLPPEDAARDGVVFVGRTRPTPRPILDLAAEAGVPFRLWGTGWAETPFADRVVADRVANAEVGEIYRGAGIVLNDHTQYMRRSGMASNRIFDALACGAAVISDDVAWLPDDVAPFVERVKTARDLAAAVRRIRGESALRRAERRAFAGAMVGTHDFDARAAVIAATARALVTPRPAA